MQPTDNIKQVGGTHYGTGFGHWDYCKLAQTPYLEGAATKYLFRWRKKNGLQDLEKGYTFLEKLMAGMTITTTNNDTDNTQYVAELEEAFNQNNVPSTERLIIQAVLTWRTYADLLWAQQQYGQFLAREQAAAEEAAEAQASYSNQG